MAAARLNARVLEQDVMVAGHRIRAPDAAQTLTQRRPITAARTASGDARAP